MIHTASVHVRPPLSTAGRKIGSDTPATNRSRSISSCGMATQTLSSKSPTLNVPVMAGRGGDHVDVDTEVGQRRRHARPPDRRTPASSWAAGRTPAAAAATRTAAPAATASAAPSSLGATPDISIPSVKIPPDVPSPWSKRSPASSSAWTTPACQATRIPPPARISARRGHPPSDAGAGRSPRRRARRGGIERGERQGLLAEPLRSAHPDRRRSPPRPWPPTTSAAPPALGRRPGGVGEQATGHRHEHADDAEQERRRLGPTGAEHPQHEPRPRRSAPPPTRRQPADHHRRRRPADPGRPRRIGSVSTTDFTTTPARVARRPTADRASRCSGAGPWTESKGSPP